MWRPRDCEARFPAFFPGTRDDWTRDRRLDRPMAKKRVHEIARERGMSSKEVIATLQKAGLDVKAAASSVDENDVARAFNGGGAPPPEKPKPERRQPQTTGGQGFAAIPQGGAPPRPRPTTQAQPPQQRADQAQQQRPAAEGGAPPEGQQGQAGGDGAAAGAQGQPAPAGDGQR